MRILIVNGPNLNLLGKRQPEIYGNKSFDVFLAELKGRFPQVELDYFQSNHEGKLIDSLQDAAGVYDGLILNAAAYAHTSIALADTLAAIHLPTVEVHISDIFKREPFRHHSYTATHALRLIAGEGLEGYAMALDYLLQELG